MVMTEEEMIQALEAEMSRPKMTMEISVLSVPSPPPFAISYQKPKWK
jgi:hypothetical protein